MLYHQYQGFKRFENALSQFQIELSEVQKQQYVDYFELLVERNKVMNLTAITEFEEVIIKHFIDSLSLVKVITPKNQRVLDLGTGAGFPGIPLKIAFPELEIVLLDSLNKRINFLNEVIEALGLRKIQAIHGRAEDIGKDKQYREGFDVCVSRAVAKLSSLCEYCIPFVKVGGYFIPYKSGQVEEEVKTSQKALKLLGSSVEQVNAFMLPESEIERTLVVIKKKEKTALKYPRSAGKPTKEPL